MTPGDLTNKLQSHAEAAAATHTPSPLPMTYENQITSHTEDKVNGEVFVRLGTRFQAAISPPMYRTPGIMIFRLTLRLNVGIALMNTATDALVAYFQGTSADGIIYQTPTVQRLGKSGDRYQVNVECPFWHDSFV